MESHFYQNHEGSSFQNVIGGNHDWNQNLILTNVNEVLLNDLTVTHNPMPLLPLITPMVQDLGFHRINKIDDDDYMKHSMVGEELSDSFPKVGKFDQIPSHKGYQFPSTLADGGIQTSDSELLFKGMSSSSRFSTVLPTMNIPSSNRPLSSSMSPVLLGMDLQALDLLDSTKDCWNLGQPNSLNTMPLLGEENLPCFGFGHFEGSTQEPSKYHHKKSSLGAGKTLRSDLHPSSFPLKVRKEKLGERIAALQQLVAPFGKTDTASVLSEAIGYIKFLQDQVETLSVPYMTSSKRLRTAEGASCDESIGCKPDLRSRGLCLVPLSCTSYVACENGDFLGHY